MPKLKASNTNTVMEYFANFFLLKDNNNSQSKQRKPAVYKQKKMISLGLLFNWTIFFADQLAIHISKY